MLELLESNDLNHIKFVQGRISALKYIRNLSLSDIQEIE